MGTSSKSRGFVEISSSRLVNPMLLLICMPELIFDATAWVVWYIALYVSIRLMSQYTLTVACSPRLSFVSKSLGKKMVP